MNTKAKRRITQNELNQVKSIANILNLELNLYKLKKIKKEYTNAYEISENNLIYFYPLNDGRSTFAFEFYKDGQLIIDNDREYSQISNLDDIILQMVRIYNKSLDYGIILDPYYFMLKLTDEPCANYHGNGSLVITEESIKNYILTEEEFNKAKKYYINHFLDHFIGWNFGVSVNRNEVLKKELEELNNKVIDNGIREYAGAGYEVYGNKSEAINGLQHFILPTNKPCVRKKALNKY